jgi:DNA polymerase sigma
MNSFNINVFGNLNIGNLVQTNNDPTKKQEQETTEQINISNQIQNLVGMPFVNIGQLNNNSNPFLVHPAAQQNLYSNYIYDYNLSQTIEFKFYEKFDNDIYDEVSRIQRILDKTKGERNYVLGKLQEMCERVFENEKTAESDNTKPKIMQFGSLMTGLALESSDMDMAVTNLFLPDRQKMIDCLD